MGTKIISVWMGIIVFTPFFSHASPIGCYIRPTVILRAPEAAAAISFAYQFNRGRTMELAYTVLDSKASATDINHQEISFADKHLLPLNHDYNLYLQWGVTLRSTLASYEPFIGCGAAFYINRKWHVDIAWRNYELLAFLKKDVVALENNNFMIGVGYFFT